jgi:hypothetical protein
MNPLVDFIIFSSILAIPSMPFLLKYVLGWDSMHVNGHIVAYLAFIVHDFMGNSSSKPSQISAKTYDKW